MARQYRSRISREFQLYTEICHLNHPQLVRNLPNILGSVQEELELAFEDELALDGHGVLFPMLDGCYLYSLRVEGNQIHTINQAHSLSSVKQSLRWCTSLQDPGSLIPVNSR